MKNIGKTLRLLLVLLILASGVAMAAPKRVLFIGNSYTGVNNLPKIFKDIVSGSEAEPPEVMASTPGGRTLKDHLSNPASLKLIDSGNWDVVVLQGQSQEAALSEVAEDIRANFLAGAKDLSQRIKAKSPAAKIVFYQTWARHADCWKAPKKGAAGAKDPTEMQARNRKWYQMAAASAPDSKVAPVGDAWELNYKDPQALRLHSKDDSHPAFNGSYLAALVIYGTIYQPQALKVAFRGSLPEAEALYLQRIATKTLLENAQRIVPK